MPEVGSTHKPIQTLSKALGYFVVWGALGVKLPQIIKIIKKGSTLGISFRAVVFEVHVPRMQTLMNCIMVGYNLYRKNPFSIYGENVFLGAQNIIVLALFFFYPNQKSFRSYIIWVLVLIVLAIPLLGQMVPGNIQEMSISFAIVICTEFIHVVIIARLEQIMENHRNKSTGNLAFLTTLLNFGGGIARSFTVLTEASGDMFLLASAAIPVLVNGYLFLQFLMYWSNVMDGSKPETPADGAKKQKKH